MPAGRHEGEVEDRRRWRIGRRMVFVVTVASAASTFASTYWWVTWWAGALPIAMGFALVAGLTLAFATVSAVFARSLVRPIVGPLNEVTSAIRRIDLLEPSATNSSRTFDVQADDPLEVAQLKRAFSQAFDRIRRDRSQREALLGGLMHDLKTPIVAQRHLLEGATRADGTVDDQVLRATQDNAREAAGRLDLLIDLLRYDAASVAEVVEDIELGPIAGRVVERAKVVARPELRIALIGEASAQVSPRGFERALENVLANAVRYAYREVVVELRAGLVAVTDDGPGFAIPFDAAIDPFRPGPSTDDRRGTAGLGLYVARRALEGFGGRLVLEATRSGRTTVLLYVPSR